MRCMYMTLVGAIGLLAYTAYSEMDPAADAVQTTGGFNESIILASPIAALPAAERDSASTSATEPEAIGEGSTRDDVVALWGNPTATDQSNDRWTYGRTVVLFSNDHVTGILTLTTKQLSNLKNVRPAAKAVARLPVATAKRAATKTTPTGRRGAPAAYPVTQNLPGGYAPMGQSARRSGQFFWAPMYRSFYTNQPMPRSQSHLSPGRSGTPTYSQSYYQRPFRR